MGSFPWLVRSPSLVVVSNYFLMGFGPSFEESVLVPSVCFSLLCGFSTIVASSYVARLAYNWNTVSNHL